jgi:hypothetical protein
MTARIIWAGCIASRWLGAASLVLTAAALVHLSENRLLLAGIIVAGAAQTLVSFRLEFDRAMLETLGEEANPAQFVTARRLVPVSMILVTFQAFAAAVAVLGWR